MRAIAVLAVMTMHSFPYLPGHDYIGGVLGVDVFFVLSGYLITTLLLREHGVRGRIGLGGFYARRALRLLPALLIALVLGAIVVALIDEVPGDRAYGTSALASLFYVANWFEVFGDMGVLAHTWSLSIEEQYYLVWPIVLSALLGRRVAHRNVAVVLCGVAAAVALTRWATYEGGHGLFASWATVTRSDGIIIGSALALALDEGREWLRRVLHSSLTAWVGGVTVLLISLMDKLGSPLLYRGGLTATNIGTACVVGHLIVRRDSLPKRVLALQPLPFIGRLSYGLYLYHLPLNFLVHGNPARWSGVASVATMFASSFALAAISYVVVEQRALRLKRRFGSMSELPSKPLAEIAPD
jgi:peptidoglycan/LPS O-acetylase OafA/YrhL